MTQGTRVTACVPTIGRMEYLPKTRACLEAQTLKDGVEIVILCNGSPPEARAYVDAWSATAPNIRVVRSDPRVPMFENFNLGIRASATEYVTFFHDDDEYTPDYLERSVSFLDRHPSTTLVGSNYDFIDERGIVTEERRWIPADALLSRTDYVSQVVERARNIIPMPGLVFRRRVLGDGFDTGLPIHWGDFVLLMQYAEVGEIGVIAEPLVRIRRHQAQASQGVPLSRSIPIRTRVLDEYLCSYATRFPEDVQLVKALRRRVQRLHRVHLLWGWANAPTKAESLACLEALGDEPVDRVSARVLGVAGGLGLRPQRATTRGLSVARKIAERLRM